ncbi:unnamed protein product [Closterium sp. NIES-54]
MGADGRLLGLKHVLLVPRPCANLLSTKALSEGGKKMEMMGTKMFKETLDGRVLWDLRGGKDMHWSIWEILVLPWKEAATHLVAAAVRGGHASHITSGGGGDGSDGGLLVHGEGALPSVTPSTGAEGEAADVEGVLQQGEAPVAESGDTEEEVQQPTPSPKHPPRRTTKGKRDAVCGGAKEGAAKERPKSAAHPRDFLKYERLGGPKALLVQEEEDEEKGAEGEMKQICCFGVNLHHEPASMEEALAGAAQHGLHPSVHRRGRESEPDHRRGRENDIGGLGSTLAVHASVIKNHELTHVGGQHWVPMEKWSGKKPLVDMLCVFGCMGLVHVPKEKHDKLQAAALWAVHMGLARGSKGWLMWDPKSNTIFTTKDAKFMEGLMFKGWSERGRSKVTIPLRIEVGTNDPLLIPIKLSSSSESTEVSHDFGGAEGEAADVEGELQQGEASLAERGDTEEDVQQPTPSPKLPPRRTTQGKRDAVCCGAKEGATKERPKRAAHPRDFLKFERLGGPKALLVQEEEDEEEKGVEGEMEQICCFGVNLPLELTSTEGALAAAICGWKVEQMDVKTTFFHGVVDEEIYMKQPQGYDDGSGLSGCDEGLFMTEEEEEKVCLLVYVDDILLFSPSLERIKEVQGKLKETFQCKARGPVGYYLGLHVERDEVKGWFRLHQHKYLAAMGEKYGLEEGRSVKTPLPSGFQLHLDKEDGEVWEYEL